MARHGQVLRSRRVATLAGLGLALGVVLAADLAGAHAPMGVSETHAPPAAESQAATEPSAPVPPGTTPTDDSLAITSPPEGPAPTAALAESAGPRGAWAWLLLFALPAATALGWRKPRGLALATAIALTWFVGQSSAHAVHHLDDSSRAERCPVFSAAQQLSGVDAGFATPVLLPPAAGRLERTARLIAPPAARIDGEPSRAPPPTV
jgi:hypothetical protein